MTSSIDELASIAAEALKRGQRRESEMPEPDGAPTKAATIIVEAGQIDVLATKAKPIDGVVNA